MPSATQMAAAKHCPWMTAATEHNPEVPLPQSTEMSAENIADDIADDIADKDIVEAETENRRLRIKTENRRLKVAPKVAPVAPPPGLSAPPGLAAPPGASRVGLCQVSKEAKESSLKNIEDGMKFFNNQSQHILKLIKAQGEQLQVQSAQMQSQSEQIKIQSEQMKEMTLMLLRVVPLER